MTVALRSPGAVALRAVLTFALFQAAWFACVGLAAAGHGAWAAVAPLAAAALQLATSDDARADLALMGAAVVLGLGWDTLAVHAGLIQYAAPGPWAWLAPAWILALWAQFASVVRVPLRWLHSRPWAAALAGAVGGPLSYAAAARMGACRFDDPALSLAVLALGWGVMTPPLLALARRLDGRAAAGAAA